MKEQAILLEHRGKKYLIIEYEEERRLENLVVSLSSKGPDFSYMATAIMKACNDKHPDIVKKNLKIEFVDEWVRSLNDSRTE